MRYTRWLKDLLTLKHQEEFYNYLDTVDEKGRPDDFDRNK